MPKVYMIHWVFGLLQRVDVVIIQFINSCYGVENNTFTAVTSDFSH